MRRTIVGLLLLVACAGCRSDLLTVCPVDSTALVIRGTADTAWMLQREPCHLTRR